MISSIPSKPQSSLSLKSVENHPLNKERTEQIITKEPSKPDPKVTNKDAKRTLKDTIMAVAEGIMVAAVFYTSYNILSGNKRTYNHYHTLSAAVTEGNPFAEKLSSITTQVAIPGQAIKSDWASNPAITSSILKECSALFSKTAKAALFILSSFSNTWDQEYLKQSFCRALTYLPPSEAEAISYLNLKRLEEKITKDIDATRVFTENNLLQRISENPTLQLGESSFKEVLTQAINCSKKSPCLDLGTFIHFNKYTTESMQLAVDLNKNLLNKDIYDLLMPQLIKTLMSVSIPEFNKIIDFIKSSPDYQDSTFKTYLNRPLSLLPGLETLGSDTLLVYAVQLDKVRYNTMPIIETLINAGADVNAAGTTGTTPLIMAAKAGNLKALQLLIENGATDLDNKAATAAANKGHNHIIAELNQLKEKLKGQGHIALQTNQETVSQSDGNVLRAAVENGNLETVKLAIKSVENVNVQGKYDAPIIFEILQSISYKLKGCKEDHIFKQVKELSIAIIQELIKAGLDLESKDTRNRTVLIAAVMLQLDVDIIKLLLTAHKNPADYIRNNLYWDQSALAIAERKGNFEIIELLTCFTNPQIN